MSKSPFGPDRVVLVTGASRGIGAALAEQVALSKGRVALFARTREQLDLVAQQVKSRGAEPLVLEGDVADLASVRGAHQQVVERWGRVDVALLNAGTGATFPLTRFDAERVRRIFEVNVFGIVHWLHCLLPPMLEAKAGTIVGISSLAAQRGGPSAGAYSASKAAVSNLLESVRLEARLSGVAVCTVEPGFVRTEMTAQNKFEMPFLMEPQDAARAICEGVARGKSVIRFPWQLAAGMALMRWMPDWLYERIGGRMVMRDRDQLRR
ncbi:MAG: SDR family NAD(P)-dependent oxidoreductase [Deltaproteobacteria bacterium]|nr:SDR family NAD(P)-dependent oxidoreductase [Deltaproteobacteria bacterium]